MADWNRGYTTGSAYTFGFYRELAPSFLNLICLLQGVVPPTGPLTCLELGCGQGLGPLLLAASNPDDTFIGVDFNPEHVARARGEAARYGVTNVSYIEAGFEDLVANPNSLPLCDVITLHGVYSWVGPAQRAAIRSIIQTRLKPGGVVYVSYNCAAGWGPSMLVQKLLFELSTARGGSLKQTTATLQRLKTLREQKFFGKLPAVEARIDTLVTKAPNYIDHEYMNRDWAALHSLDVARDLGACKLTFVGSGHPMDNLMEFVLPPEIVTAMADDIDLGLLELLKDTFSAKPFRSDVFIKGAQRMSPNEQHAALRQQSFALLKPKSTIKLEVVIPRGTLQLGKSFYADALAALADGPNTFASLRLPLKETKDLIAALLTLRAIHPARPDAAPSSEVLAMNRDRVASTESLFRYRYLAAPQLGSAYEIEAPVAPGFAAAARGEATDRGALEALHADARYAAFYRREQGGPVPVESIVEAWPDHVSVWHNLGILAPAEQAQP